MNIKMIKFSVKRIWNQVKRYNDKNMIEFNNDFVIYDYNENIVRQSIEKNKKLKIDNLPKIILEQYMAHVNLLKFTLNATAAIGILLCMFFYNQQYFDFSVISFLSTVFSFLGLWFICTYCRNIDQSIEKYFDEHITYSCLIKSIFIYNKRIFNIAFVSAIPFMLSMLCFMKFFVSKTIYIDNIMKLILI